MAAEILLGHQSPSLRFRQGKGPVDLLLFILGAHEIALRRRSGSRRGALIPQLQDPAPSVLLPEIRMAIIHAGIHDPHQDPLPSKPGLLSISPLHGSDTGGFRALIRLEIQTFWKLHKFNLRPPRIFLKTLRGERHYRVSSQKRNRANVLPGQRFGIPAVFHHHVPDSRLSRAASVKVS